MFLARAIKNIPHINIFGYKISQIRYVKLFRQWPFSNTFKFVACRFVVFLAHRFSFNKVKKYSS